VAVRILVVDDFAPWRRLVSSTFQDQGELQIICEAADGLEAVQKAAELQPDVILLDIGLPTLNGIEAARQIRSLAPKSKILFLSQDSSSDVVQDVLGLGAWGYVVKSDAGKELLTAVNAVVRGDRFIGSRFAGHDFTGTAQATAPESVLRNKAVAPLQLHKRCHEVQFYSDDACFLDGLSHFIEPVLKAGSAVIVIVTESHRDKLLPRLQAQGLDIGAALVQGRYVSLDPAETLSTFMVHDLPDPVRFSKVASDLIAGAVKAGKGEHPRVAACGECSPLLWAQGQAEAAIWLERLWDEVARTYDIDVLCGYPRDSFEGEPGSHVFQRVCAEHSAIYSP
jgi:DNA-binding NarL/FixJ family response regulator